MAAATIFSCLLTGGAAVARRVGVIGAECALGTPPTEARELRSMTAGALADTEVRGLAAGAGVAETAEVGVAGSFLPVFFASLAYDMSL